MIIANKNTQRLMLVGVLVASAFCITSCKNDPLSPGVEYMPDMYRGPALETYSSSKLNGEDVPTAKTPATNTIARGFEPYAYPNTPEGYEAAGANLKNPLADLGKATEDGKVIYTKYCVHCHGAKGDGQGTIKVKGDAFPVPSYFDESHKNLPDGKMFHTLHYGKGLMGSHASQLTKEERWKLVAYVNKLQNEGLGITEGVTTQTITDSTKTTTK